MHRTHHLVVHLRHVLDLVEKMLLLLSLKHLVLRDNLNSVDGLVILLWNNCCLPLVSVCLLKDVAGSLRLSWLLMRLSLLAGELALSDRGGWLLFLANEFVIGIAGRSLHTSRTVRSDRAIASQVLLTELACSDRAKSTCKQINT